MKRPASLRAFLYLASRVGLATNQGDCVSASPLNFTERPAWPQTFPSQMCRLAMSELYAVLWCLVRYRPIKGDFAECFNRVEC